jgi:hypothetical protein
MPGPTAMQILSQNVSNLLTENARLVEENWRLQDRIQELEMKKQGSAPPGKVPLKIAEKTNGKSQPARKAAS